MFQDHYRFEMDESVLLSEVEMTLHLAMLAVEGLHGQASVRLEGRYRLDEPGRALLVDASTEVGKSLVRVFTGLLIRELGEDAFSVRRVSDPEPPCSPGAEPVPLRQPAREPVASAA